MGEPDAVNPQPATGLQPGASGRKIALNTVLLSATELLTRLVSLALIIVVARLLGPAMLGLYAFALTLIRVCDLFLNFGLDRYLQREVGRQPEQAGPLFSQVLVLKSLMYLVILAVVGALSFLLVDEPLKRQVLLLLTLALFFRTHTASAAAFFRARQQARYEAGVVITLRLLYGGAGLVAVLAGQGLITLVVLELVAQAAACLVALALFWRKIASPWQPVAWSGLLRLISASRDFFLIRLVLTLSSSLNLILLSWLAGDLATGFYAAALRLTGSFDFLPEAFTGAFLPVISRQARENWPGFISVCQHYLKYLAILGFGLASALAGLAPGIIALIFGPAFQPAAPVLGLLAVALALEFLNLALTNTLIALNAEGQILGNFALVLVVNLSANLLLIPIWQAPGAAWAAVLAEVLVLALQLRTMGLSRLRELAPGALTWRPLLSALLAYGLGRWALLERLPLPASLALTGLGYLLALCLSGALSRYEWQALKTWLGEGRNAA